MTYIRKTAALFSLAFAFASPSWANSNEEQSPQERTLPTVTVSETVTQEVVARIPISGDVVAVEEVLVYPHVSGFGVQSLDAELGDFVQQGEVLATLDDATLAAQLAQAQAALDQANAELARAQTLRRSGAISQASFDQTNAAALNAKSQLDIMMENHGSAQILAPVSGVISARNSQIGAISTAAGEPMYRIIKDGQVEVLAQVPETLLSGLTVTDPVELNMANGKIITGALRRVAPVVDPQTRLADVWISLNEQADLQSGMFASGWIITDRHEGLVVPVTAVLSDRSGDFVQVVTDNIVEKRPVQAGVIWEDQREILNGLNEGETVMTRAGAFFADGDEVNAIPASQNLGDAS